MPRLSKLKLPVLVSGEIQEIEYDLPGGGGGSSSPEELGIGYGVCSTAYTITAKTASLTDYNLVENGIVAIRFVNSVNANATLDINGKGSKPIYYRGKPIINGIIRAGDTVTLVYDGSSYRILMTDSPWKAYVNIIGDPNALVTITNSTYELIDTVILNSNGRGNYVCKAPGEYTFSVEDE